MVFKIERCEMPAIQTPAACGLACDASARDAKSLAMWVERCEPLSSTLHLLYILKFHMSRERLYAPPAPPFWPRRYFEAPRGRNFFSPPLFYTPPSPRRVFSGVGGGCIKFGTVICWLSSQMPPKARLSSFVFSSQALGLCRP